jgi:HEAT repeat protein
MNLFFCPKCRRVFSSVQSCPDCKVIADEEAKSYVEKLLETVLSKETNRAGMAVDVLIKWLHEPRAFLPLTLLLKRTDDPYPLVIGARGLGWLGNKAAVSALAKLLLNESQPYVGRVAAAEALSGIGGKESIDVLSQARQSPRSSVAEACNQALQKLLEVEQETQS